MWRPRYMCLVIVSVLVYAYVPAKAQQPLPDQDADHGHDHHAGTDAKVPWYTWDALFDPDFHGKQYADTTLKGFHQYDFYQKGSQFYGSKGNTGHATRPLYFTPGRDGFHLHKYDLYPHYLHTFDSVRFYKPDHVFSELFYVLGSDREQMFYAKHNQRLHEHVYGGFKYKSVNSPGRYGNMDARNSNFMLYAEAQPWDDYHVAGSFIINRIFNTESGGLEDPEAFEEDEVQAFMVLDNADTRLRDIGFRIEQSYKPAFSGTGQNDTVDNVRGLNLGELRHAFSYKRESYVFEHASAPSSYFYEDAEPFNELSTLDSTVVHQVNNTLRWTNLADGSKEGSLIRYSLYVDHLLLSVRQPLLETNEEDELPEDNGEALFRERFSQFKPGVRIMSDPKRTLAFDGFANYTLGGYNDQDYQAGGSISGRKQDSGFRLSLQAAYTESEAPYFMQHMRSNYVRWENEFRKSRTLHFGIRFQHAAFRLEGNYYLLNRALFLDAEGYPVQHDHSFPVFSAGISSRLDIGSFKTHHRVIAQFVDEDHYERLPGILSHHTLYGEFSLFDDALFAHTGIDIRYNAPYKPMNYMPMVRHFSLQDDYETDHDMLVDIFVNAQISRARLFVKFEHVLGWLTDHPPVYEIPFYPLPEAMFKFGVSWMFFN